MSITHIIKKHIESVLEELDISGVDFVVEHPAELAHGDITCNAALVAAKNAGKNPRTLADEIMQGLSQMNIPEIDSVSIAGPGFINIFLSKKYFSNLFAQIKEKGAAFGKSDIYSGKNILVEHSSPNLFKPFHIGHMMNNAIGESLVRLMQFSGANVTAMSFPSDISLGVAKAIYILLEKYENVLPSFIRSLKDPNYDGFPNMISIEILGDAYTQGTKRYDEEGSIHARVKEIADNLYQSRTSEELELFEACKSFNIEYFEKVVKGLGSKFDSYIYESEAGVRGKELVLENTPKVFTESEGAVVYIPDESKKHINTAVFVNSQGNPTYEAKDLGLIEMKFKRFHPDLSLFVTDHEQIPHFNVVLDAGEQIFPEYISKSIHVPHGRMTFKGQKMSSRLGGVPLAEEMIETVAEEARERAKDKEQVDNAQSIAIAAIKFAILRAKPGQNINFDPETSLSFEGDSGPYLQYTHARISSLLEKALSEFGFNAHYTSEYEIIDIERVTAEFPLVVERAIQEQAPQYVVTYLLELARSFNAYYASSKIIDADNSTMSQHRLAVVGSVGQVIYNGLNLLGIHAPTRM